MVAARRLQNPMGWLMLAAGTFVLANFDYQYAFYGLTGPCSPLAIVDDTLQPESVALWLKGQE